MSAEKQKQNPDQSSHVINKLKNRTIHNTRKKNTIESYSKIRERLETCYFTEQLTLNISLITLSLVA